MKIKLQVQFHNKNVETTSIEKLVKEDVKSKGVKMTTIDTLEVYINQKILLYIMLRQQKLVKSLVMTNHYTSVNLNITNIYPNKEAKRYTL